MVSRFVSMIGFDATIRQFTTWKDSLGTASWVVGTPIHYSVFVEFGTSRMAAQPYLRPAVESAKRNMASLMSNASDLPSALGQIAMAIERKAKQLCPVDTGTLRASISAQQVG